jgi:hypothetical protein
MYTWGLLMDAKMMKVLDERHRERLAGQWGRRPLGAGGWGRRAGQWRWQRPLAGRAGASGGSGPARADGSCA